MQQKKWLTKKNTDVDVSGLLNNNLYSTTMQLKNSSIIKFKIYKNKILSIFNNQVRNRWEINGKPVPTPHIVKQLVIKEFQEKYKTPVLIETGTYLGDMVFAQRNNFKQIYSIELGKDLYESASKRFRSFPHINILQGDSGIVLHKLIPEIKQRSLFWLDGHYSGSSTAKANLNCPIYEELKAILSSNIEHIILIDDARLFNGTNDYPTIQELSNYILSKNKDYKIEIVDDIIRGTI